MAPSPGSYDYAPTEDDFGKEVIIALTNGVEIYNNLIDVSRGDEFILSSNFAPGHRVKLCVEGRYPLRRCPPGYAKGFRYGFYDYITGGYASGYDDWHYC